MKVLKGFVIFLVIVLSIIVIIVSCSDTEEEPVAEPEEEVAAVEEAETVTETEPAYDIEANEKMVLEILEESYEGLGTIELDSEGKVFYITPSEEIIPDLVATQAGDPQAVQSWNEAVEAFIFASNNMKDILPGYTLALRNPASPELILLAVLDGSVIYDFTND